MTRPILQYRPLDRGFLLLINREASALDWQKTLRGLPGNLHGKDRLTPARVRVFLSDGRLVETHAIPLRWQRAFPWLASITSDSSKQLSGSLSFWVTALRLLQSLVLRGALLPRLDTRGNPWRATWGMSLTSPTDRSILEALLKSMPPSTLAFPEDDSWTFTKRLSLGTLNTEELDDDLAMPPSGQMVLRAFLEDGVDFLVRFVSESIRQGENPRLDFIRRLQGHKRDRLPWGDRLMVALSHSMNEFPTVGITERTLGEQLEQWSEGAKYQWIRPTFILETPPVPPGGDVIQDIDRFSEKGWVLKVGLETQEADVIPVARLWEASSEPEVLEARKVLLRGLARATPFFPPLQRALSGRQPEDLILNPAEAWQFLTKGATQLREAGFLVHIPETMAELGGARRLRARVLLGARNTIATDTQEVLGGHISADWSLMLGGDSLNLQDFAQMASLKHPLITWKGKWVALDLDTLKQITQVIQASCGAGFESMNRSEALAAALTGTAHIPGVSEAIEVETTGEFGASLNELKILSDKSITQPKSFIGQLRPYQLRGLAWLEGLSRFGLGGILADDMGLGKTIEVLALLLHRQEISPLLGPPTLLICPTSLLGNWGREISKFAPNIPCFIHHGNNRDNLPIEFKPHTIVLTTYGVIRREEEVFINRIWGMIVVDEAQAIKNAGSHQAKTVRRLRAPFKLALTGTPIENRLLELWSIMSFVLPNYLKNESSFKDQFASPIEKYRDQDRAMELRKLVGPFILRRLKTDRTIIQDLPEKHEMKVYTQLSREQALLYKARVSQMDQDILSANGIERRGRILALLSSLKQICNHPTQFLKQPGPYKGRSGKLERLTEMLEEVLETGEKAVIFTQFKEMGDRLQIHLKDVLGFEPPFLHGGSSREQRDEMVRSFQEDFDGAKVMLLSLKAGGVGLNLTAATHVFHFDRWWNPAVEDQATDRTYRIGQMHNVQVHKFITMGTLEEKIDTMLESKRDLADLVVGTDEGWITELDYNTLHRLVALEPDIDIMSEDEVNNKNGTTSALPVIQTTSENKSDITICAQELALKVPHKASLKTKDIVTQTTEEQVSGIKIVKRKKTRTALRKGMLS